MKNLYILMLLFFSTVTNAQVVNIPDSNFKNALIQEGVDTNNDGEIQVSEAEAVSVLKIYSRSISSLEGIQSFVNLVELDCSNNQLSSLDLSQNLNLQSLDCGYNQLSSLNVSQNTNLKSMYCDHNAISVLDVSQNLFLEKLWCAYNPLGSLDVTQNVNLLRLYCGKNQLTQLDVSQNLNLEFLLFDDNLISSIDLTQNLSLIILTCRNNNLNSLDLSQNISLEHLECADNQLTSLNISNGNNHNMLTMISTGNPDLPCIQVDDENTIHPECGDDLPTEGWCRDPWTSYSNLCKLGVTSWAGNTYVLYPNPVSDKLILDSTSEINNLIVNIFNIEGRLLKTQNLYFKKSESLDVSGLSNGIYILNIEDKDGNTTIKKFVKR